MGNVDYPKGITTSTYYDQKKMRIILAKTTKSLLMELEQTS